MCDFLPPSDKKITDNNGQTTVSYIRIDNINIPSTINGIAILKDFPIDKIIAYYEKHPESFGKFLKNLPLPEQCKSLQNLNTMFWHKTNPYKPKEYLDNEKKKPNPEYSQKSAEYRAVTDYWESDSVFWKKENKDEYILKKEDWEKLFDNDKPKYKDYINKIPGTCPLSYDILKNCLKEITKEYKVAYTAKGIQKLLLFCFLYQFAKYFTEIHSPAVKIYAYELLAEDTIINDTALKTIQIIKITKNTELPSDAPSGEIKTVKFINNNNESYMLSLKNTVLGIGIKPKGTVYALRQGDAYISFCPKMFLCNGYKYEICTPKTVNYKIIDNGKNHKKFLASELTDCYADENHKIYYTDIKGKYHNGTSYPPSSVKITGYYKDIYYITNTGKVRKINNNNNENKKIFDNYELIDLCVGNKYSIGITKDRIAVLYDGKNYSMLDQNTVSASTFDKHYILLTKDGEILFETEGELIQYSLPNNAKCYAVGVTKNYYIIATEYGGSAVDVSNHITYNLPLPNEFGIIREIYTYKNHIYLIDDKGTEFYCNEDNIKNENKTNK